MSEEPNETEEAMLNAVGERLKKPFRLEEDTRELSRDRVDWQARKSTVKTLMEIGNASQYLDEALAGLHDPGRGANESEADAQIRELWRRVKEIFPGLTSP